MGEKQTTKKTAPMPKKRRKNALHHDLKVMKLHVEPMKLSQT